MIKEFLATLYKMCSGKESDSDAIDETWDVIIELARERRFETLNSILATADVSKLTTGVEYAMVHLTSPYINQLPDYRDFYQRVREDFARRHRPEKEIKNLFDRYRDGHFRDLYDPNEPEYIPPEKKDKQKLDDKIAWALSIGDKDLANYLTWYKMDRINSEARNDEFNRLRAQLGDKELRKKAIESLRGIADILEKSEGSWPGIYYCTLSKWADKRIRNRDVMDGVTVVLSYPWGG